MNLTRPSEIRDLLDRLGIRPRKSLGQHFLIDGNILDILLNAADLKQSDRVLEVGPGLGTVTQRLLETGAQVVAIEKDARMAAWLEEFFADQSGLRLLHEDALKSDWGKLLAGPYGVKVVANLPYGVGSRILVDWVRSASPPELIVVTVQLEVAERLAARPGDKDYGLLSVWTQLRYDVDIVKTVSRTCFLPPPVVASAIVRMTRHERLPISDRSARLLYDIVGTAFRHRRKQLATSLPHSPQAGGAESADIAACLKSLGLNPRSRPSDLSVDEWRQLAERLLEGKSVDRAGTTN